MTLLSTISFALYIREAIPMKKKRIFSDLLTSLTIIYAAACLILECLNISGLRDALPITLIVLATFFGYNMVIFIIETFRYNNERASKELRAIFIFMLFGALETVLYFLNEQKETSHYILIGAIAYIFLALINHFKEQNERQKIKRDKEYFEKVAYTDALT